MLECTHENQAKQTSRQGTYSDKGVKPPTPNECASIHTQSSNPKSKHTEPTLRGVKGGTGNPTVPPGDSDPVLSVPDGKNRQK